MSTMETVATEKGVWQIDAAHTEVEFAVRHLMISTVKGRFSGVEGRIVFDESDIAAASADIRIDAASIDTRNADRDKHLRSADFFEVERYPEILFRSSAAESGPDGIRLVGDLTIRGITRTVALDVDFEGSSVDPWGQRRLGFHAETRINRKDFGLTWNQALEAGGVLVGDEIRITLEVQAIQEAVEG